MRDMVVAVWMTGIAVLLWAILVNLAAIRTLLEATAR